MKNRIGALVVGAVLCAGAVGVARAGTLPSQVSAGRIAAASTRAEHLAIADAYARQADAFDREALTHRSMDSWYPEPGYLSGKLGQDRHCRRLVRTLEASARDARESAADHRAMAERAR